MAVAKPYGFALFRASGVNATNEQGTTYTVLAAEANAWYIGDTCKSVAGGDAQGFPAMQKDTTGIVPVRGIVMGIINPFPGGVSVPSLVGSALPLELTTIPATKTQNYYVVVCEDMDQLYTAQDDGATAANVVATNANKNSNIT